MMHDHWPTAQGGRPHDAGRAPTVKNPSPTFRGAARRRHHGPA